jgi:anaerobic magnesium-protoporphyrin IX monomethyl ester cyclase
MHIFLIYVRDNDFYRLLPAKISRRLPDNGRVRVMAFPPLGIQTLAPILRQHGHRVRLFDMCHPRMQAPDIVQAVKEERPDVIALSNLSVTTYPAVKRLAERCKGVAKNIPIILGGIFASMNPTLVLADCPQIDCVGVGEGEELLPDYLNHLDAPGAVAGLVWRREKEIIQNSRRPLIEDLDRFPYPDRDSLPIDYIESLPMDVPAVLSLDKFCTIQTSRGCPYNCIYCDIPAYSQRKWRYRSAEHVLGEMQELNDKGYCSIYFTDDHFLLNRKRIKEICCGIIERKFAFRWGCEGRVDSVAMDQFPFMSEANCHALSFGIESGTQAVLDRLGKKQTLQQIEHAVTAAKRSGIRKTHGFFLIGAPGETKKQVMASFRFAARLKLDTFNFNRLCVYRGTPLWKEYVDRGIIEDERDWRKWFKCSDIDPTVLPGEVLNRLRMKGYVTLFVQRLATRPIQTIRLIHSFSRNMQKSDFFSLLFAPFRRRQLSHKPDLPAKMADLGIEEPQRAFRSTTRIRRLLRIY